MFKCPCCKINTVVAGRQDVYAHLNNHKDDGTLKLPLICEERKCNSFCYRIRDFIRHFTQKHTDWHSIQIAGMVLEELDEQDDVMRQDVYDDEDYYSTSESEPDGSDELCTTSESEADETPKTSANYAGNDFINEAHASIFNFILLIRSKTEIPYSTSCDILKMLEEFTSRLLSNIVKLVASTEKQVQQLEDVRENFSSIIDEVNHVRSIFKRFSSEWLIRKAYKTHPQFVSPKTMKLNASNSAGGHSTFQYVPITNTISSLVKSPRYSKILLQKLKKPSSRELYRTYLHGTRFTESLFMTEESSNSTQCIRLLLQLYADGVGITNPLRYSNHNVTLFHFSILNVPAYFNSSTSNLHLLAVCNTRELPEKNNYDPVLECIMEEVRKLERDGIVIEMNSEDVCVKATLFQFTGDNLALNATFGLTTCFSTDYCCCLCYGSRSDMQQNFMEELFHLRTPESYELDIQGLLDGLQGQVRGVKRYCPLNNSYFFHIMNNWINDSMHTVLEGVIPYSVAAILYALHEEDHNIDCDLINNRMNLIISRLKSVKNKPPLLHQIRRTEMKPTFTAAQSWNFFRYLPLALCDYVDSGSKYWHLLLLLQEIVDMIMAIKHSEATLIYLGGQIEEFLRKFKKIFPDLSITPKMHFLVHFPTIIRKNGPTRQYWAMGFERLNGLVKKPAYSMKNFRSPMKTIAFKKQCQALHQVVFESHIKAISAVNSAWTCSADDLRYLKLPSAYQLPKYTTVTSHVDINGISYKTGSFVISGKNEETGLLTFGRIDKILLQDKDNPRLALQTFATVGFQQKSYTFFVNRVNPPTYSVQSHVSLLDPHAIDGVRLGGAEYHIRLKHFVF